MGGKVMRKMKDSGIEWIGQIPEEWEVRKVKNIVESIGKGTGITKEEVFVDGDTPCVRYGEIYSKYNIFFTKCDSATKRDVLAAFRYFQHGDLLCAGTGELVEEIGKAIVYMGDEKCLAGGDIIIVSHRQNPLFMSFALNSQYVQIQKSRNKTKLKVVHISATEIGNLLLVLPSIPEQTRIATYLDRKCSEIDSIVRETEQTIEEYKKLKQSLITEVVTGKKRVAADGLSLSNEPRKMKDSGVEWIGEVPEEWDKTKLSVLCSFHNGDRSKNYPSPEDFKDEGVPFYGAEALCGFDADLSFARFITLDKYNTMGGLKIQKNDILYTLRGSTIGKNAMVYREHGTTASSLMGIRCKNEHIYPRYMLFWLNSKCEFYQRDVCINGSTAPNLSAEDVSAFFMYKPSLEEQHLIATYLDAKCSEIDKLIADKQTLLQELDTYKKSLIYECVTGKREVN